MGWLVQPPSSTNLLLDFCWVGEPPLVGQVLEVHAILKPHALLVGSADEPGELAVHFPPGFVCLGDRKKNLRVDDGCGFFQKLKLLEVCFGGIWMVPFLFQPFFFW